MPTFKHHQFTVEEIQSMSPQHIYNVLIAKGFRQTGSGPHAQFMVPMLCNFSRDTTLRIENGVLTFQQEDL